MALFQLSRKGWERVKTGIHSAQLLAPQTPLANWANGDQMVYSANPSYLEIGQGGTSPMRGWGAVVFVAMILIAVDFIFDAVPYAFETWKEGEISTWMFSALALMGLLMVPLMAVPLTYFVINFFSVTDAVVRLDAKRQKVWLWTGKGPIELDWAKLTPRVESSVATAYATVKTYRGQYAELDSDGQPKRTNGIPHIFQCGQISAAEEAVLPSMEYVRRYMESGPQSVQPPAKFLSHKTHWYAMVNLFGMADDWVLWKENRDRPGIAPAPWTRTVIFILFFPVFFPMQFTNWLALVLAPRPKWPKELEAMHQADLARWQVEESARRRDDPLLDRAKEANTPHRKPVIRVNGELISGSND